MRIFPSLVRVLWLVLTLWTEVCRCSGYVELQVMSVRSELGSGGCCVGGPEERCGGGVCVCVCVFLRACLREYRAAASTTGPCSYGSAATPVTQGNGGTTHRDAVRNAAMMHIPFHFAWPRAFTLTLEAWHWDNHTQRASEELLIQRLTYKAVMDPGEQFQVLHLRGDAASVELSLSVRCHKHYYGNKCNKQCRPRDDYFGHYGCDADGNRECVEGWTGQDCTTAVCKQGCNPPKGRCDVPGECKCRVGWQGPLCEECVPYPGCKHGSCVEPWQCLCNKDWGGMLCDRDLNYCGSHQPCRNGGVCSHPVPGEYSCQCPPGYSGRNCENAEHACVSNPCVNGGTCHEVTLGFECHCPPGWGGPTCAKDLDECLSEPCSHGGTCMDLENGFECVCSPQWSGKTCQMDVNDCIPHPCYNGGVCVDGENWFRCECAPGFSGPDCRISVGVVCVLAAGAVPHGSHWEQECNVCQCVNGDVHCTQVYCGPRPCLLEGLAAAPQRPLCAGGQQCTPHPSLSCLRPPCRGGGICLPPHPPAPPHTPCQPNSRYQDDSCARVTLVLDREALPQGSTVEGVCSELQYLPIMQSLARDHALLILCDQSQSDVSAVEVAMSYVRHEHPKIQEVMRRVISALSKHHNSTLLLAVREANIQTPVLSASRDYLLPLLCVLSVLLWLVCVCVCVLWTVRRRREQRERHARTPEQDVDNRHRADGRGAEGGRHRADVRGPERGREGGDGAEEHLLLHKCPPLNTPHTHPLHMPHAAPPCRSQNSREVLEGPWAGEVLEEQYV